jgi:hypothetical protein
MFHAANGGLLIGDHGGKLLRHLRRSQQVIFKSAWMAATLYKRINII